MSFCDRDKQFIDSGFTCIDNKFIINYMTDAPDMRTAVYLLGLTLSQSEGSDNSCETMAQKLGITKEEILDAYRYWEEMGLVSIVGDEPRIIYTSIQDEASSLKKIKPTKYSKFSRDIQNVIDGRMITVNEYNEYYLFLENTTFDPDALVAVAKYCVELKGNDINYRYILTVARNLLQKGATTLVAVVDSLDSQQKYDSDLKCVFKALGSNKKIEHADRQAYEKWVKEMGFTLEVVVAVAKQCKGGMAKLDNKLCEYYKKGAMSVAEMSDYDAEKTRLYDLARNICKSIGVYYQNVDPVVDEYVVVWSRRGYEDETLLAIAKYCFKSGIRTLTGMSSVIDKLYKNGVTTLSSLTQYLSNIALIDEKIAEILALAGLDRKVTASDRSFFKNWTENWNLDPELIDFVAQKSAGTAKPMAYINRILSDYKDNGVKSVEEAKKLDVNISNKTTNNTKSIIGGRDMERRPYTEEQLSALFNILDESED